MRKSKVDWERHIDEFEKSGLKAPEFCKSAGLNLGSFRANLYKIRSRSVQRPAKTFKEFSVASEITIVRDDSGEISIRGLDASLLAAVIGAWSNALS